jgi:hypothetical protein
VNNLAFRVVLLCHKIIQYTNGTANEETSISTLNFDMMKSLFSDDGLLLKWENNAVCMTN